MKLSELKTPKEQEAARLLGELLTVMGELSQEARERVYRRWETLHVLLPKDVKAFEKNVLRCNDASGKDRRFK